MPGGKFNSKPGTTPSLLHHQGISCLFCGIPQSASTARGLVGFSYNPGGGYCTVSDTTVLSDGLFRLLYMIRTPSAISTAAPATPPTAMPAIAPVESPFKVDVSNHSPVASPKKLERICT